jgi:site-specific DNA-methyltransferase (adenine-specific)
MIVVEDHPMPAIQPLPREIQLLEQAATYLEKCQDLDEVKSIRDKAEAIRLYQKKIGQSQRSQNAAAAIKIRAERQMGRLLAAMPKHNGDPRFHDGTRLRDLGVGKTESHRCQTIAAVPTEEFERTIATAVQDNSELTSREVYNLGRRHQRNRQRRERLEAAAARPAGPTAWEVRQGDCLKRMDAMEAGLARLMVPDPPYNQGVDYGDGFDDQRHPEDYLAWSRQWLAAATRVLAPDGSLWLLCNHLWSAQLRIAAEAAGLHWHHTITWYESFGENQAGDFNRCSRPLLWFVKDPDRFVFHAEAPEIRRPSDRQAKYDDARANPGGKLWDDVWGINPPIPRLTGTCAERLPEFPTQLPIRLLRPIVACASDPGDLVVDPFSGSATTGTACIELGRRFIGIERSAKFVELSRLRLRDAAAAVVTQS